MYTENENNENRPPNKKRKVDIDLSMDTEDEQDTNNDNTNTNTNTRNLTKYSFKNTSNKILKPADDWIKYGRDKKLEIHRDIKEQIFNV